MTRLVFCVVVVWWLVVQFGAGAKRKPERIDSRNDGGGGWGGECRNSIVSRFVYRYCQRATKRKAQTLSQTFGDRFVQLIIARRPDRAKVFVCADIAPHRTVHAWSAACVQ